MSHPDPLFDSDNSYEDDNMDYNYDDHNDFYGENLDYSDYNDDGDFDDENSGEVDWEYDDSMDGDHDSAMTSAGWGTDEDYGFYGDDGREDFHSDEAIGFVDYNEDGPYYD